MRCRFTSFLLALLCCLHGFPGLVHAQDPGPHGPGPSREAPVPLLANYSMAEAVTVAAIYPTAMLLLTMGGKFIDQPTPSIGSPHPDSLDYRISQRVHGDLATGKAWLGGVPDKSAYVLAVLPALYYATLSSYKLTTGDNLLGFQGEHIHHSSLAFFEAFGWTALVTTTVKFLVGRERPYVALDRPQFAWKPDEQNLSFFSGHAALSFAAATFLYLDISDGLTRRTMSDWSPSSRFLAGRVLPFVGLYGIASTIGYSRIRDQKHYFSDVVTGALVGTLISALVYSVRFDHDGLPRQRHAASESRANPDRTASALDVTSVPMLVSDGQDFSMVWSMTMTW